MRTIYDFHGKRPQVSFSGRPYTTNPPAWHDAYIEGIIVDGGDGGDCLHVEGSLASLKLICEDMLEQLNSLEESFRAEVEDQIANAVQCPVCNYWYDKRYLKQTEPQNRHGDGRGMICQGDGTVLMGNRQIVLSGAQTGTSPYQVASTYVEHLKAGDQFSIKEPIGDYEKRDFIALEDAFKSVGNWYVKINREAQ